MVIDLWVSTDDTAGDVWILELATDMRSSTHTKDTRIDEFLKRVV